MTTDTLVCCWLIVLGLLGNIYVLRRIREIQESRR